MKSVNYGGYVTVRCEAHPKADKSNGRVLEHVLVAEKTLGKHLPAGAVVHHVDGDKTNNAPSNLVVCQDRAYHNLLERRIRAKKACGNPSWLRCTVCKEYGPPEIMGKTPHSQFYHRPCAAKRQRERNARRDHS